MNVNKQLSATIIAAAVAALVVAGCSSKPADKPADAPKAAEPAPASKEFTAKSADGKLEVKVRVSGTVAMVEMNAKDFTWNSAHAKKDPGKDVKNADKTGHAILTLGSKEPMYAGSMRTSLTKLEPGKQNLKVQLVNNDNSPLNIETTVDLEVN